MNTTLAEKLREQRKNIAKEFDFETFGEFVLERMAKRNTLKIGVVQDCMFENNNLKKRKQIKHTDCKWLSFADWYECGYWHTDCQIPQSIIDNITSWLRCQGFSVSTLSLCGFSPSVIEIKL